MPAFSLSPVPRLAPGVVHVWRASLELPPPRVSGMYEVLSQEEQTRADRFRFPVHRARFIAAHTVLRALLAEYAGVGGDRSFPIVIGPHGKPELAGGSGLRFNLAHSDDGGLFGFALDCELGVDLEKMSRRTETAGLARRVFSPHERAALESLPAERRHTAFYHLWTQKEAYLKGRGAGVSYGLRVFDVSADPDRPARLLADRHDPAAPSRWTLRTIEAGPDFRAALAVQHLRPQVLLFSWPGEAG